MASDSPDVTLALVAQKIDALNEKIDERDKRMEAQLHDHEQRIRCNERGLVGLEQRQGLWGGVLAALSLLLSSVAAWLGVR